MHQNNTKLVAFFKGTAGEFNQLDTLAIPIMAAAAYLRSHVSPIRAAVCGLCEGEGKVPMADGPDDFQWETCAACGGSGRVVVDQI